LAITAFLDTSVLLAGLVDFGPQSAPAQSLLHAVVEQRITAATAWHCCLEFFSVATRMPPEFRLTPSDAAILLHQ
jgi:predicted nucleic acid-binding protein